MEPSRSEKRITENTFDHCLYLGIIMLLRQSLSEKVIYRAILSSLAMAFLFVGQTIAQEPSDENVSLPPSDSITSEPAEPPSDAELAAASTSTPSGVEGTPQELPEGYQEELDRRIQLFRDLRIELEDAITKQREIYIRYANREQYGPEFRRAYSQQRNRARVMMSKVYDAALDVLRMGFDQEAITYMVTMLQHRHSIGVYDNETLEGAARLIDGGSNLQYMFEIAARSAIVCGQFDMAKQLYEALPNEDQKEVDLRLEFTLEDLKQEFEIERKKREAEFEADNLPRVQFKTTQGDFVVELFLDQAPSAVAHFIRLVEEGFYDGKDFFQVIEHLLALAGDPDFEPGDPSVRFLVDEHQRPDARSGMRGSLVMAKVPREGESEENFYPNSASNQFAILLTPIVNAQKDQTVFGSVIEGMETISRLNRVDPHQEKKKGEEQVPADSIIEATILRRPDSLPDPIYVN
ncbi:peptidylprolyl isomerase [Rubripirellula sp.]|nr:peptidylprolyl isomerase [Rubripirellula sp.]